MSEMKQKTSPKRVVLVLLCTFLLFSGFLFEATGSVFFKAKRPQRERLFQHVAMVPLGPNIRPKGCATRQETWERIFRGKIPTSNDIEVNLYVSSLKVLSTADCPNIPHKKFSIRAKVPPCNKIRFS